MRAESGDVACFAAEMTLPQSITFVVMLTGCLALFQSFEGLRVLHLFLAELLLVYFPFSNLMHALMFVPSRGYTGAMLGRRGIHA